MLRYASDNEKAQIRDKWHYCFGDTDPFLSWYFDNVYSPHNTLVAEEEGKILSSLQLLPYNVALWGGVRADYVAGVATLPEARGRGYAAALLRHAVLEMKKRGSIVSLLIPFNFGFYEKYGWETCYELESISGDIGLLSNFLGEGGALISDSIPQKEYEIFTKGKNGYILRGEREWGEILSGGAYGEIHARTLKGGGFILYTLQKDTINVHEIGFSGVRELRSLLGFIHAHGAQVRRFEIRTAAGTILPRVLSEKGIERRVYPHAMARVLDVSAVLSYLSKEIETPVSLTIHDPIIPENNGGFTARGGRVERKGKGFEMSIGTFTRLATGFISAHEAVELELIEGDAEGLTPLFRKQQNYINMLGWV